MPEHRLHPRYWPTWLLYGLLRAVVYLPYAGQRWLGAGLGTILRIASSRRRHIAKLNIARCLPELDARAQRILARKHFHALGLSFLETADAYWMPRKRLRALVELSGLENLEAALALQRGLLLLTAHFTTLEIGGAFIRFEVPRLRAVYRPNRNALLDALIKRGREHVAERAIPRHEVRDILKSLKDHIPVWYAPDQGYRGAQSAMISFFGHPAPTTTATSRLARASGAPVLPFFAARLPGNRGYRLWIEPMLADFPSDDPITDTERLHRVLEQQIRRAPEQYLWSHDRFKIVPRD
ncbi:MAG: lipid A biosynthesis acyltransferase [Gammaproteobacteria bacterium]|nr:lipid A biosynthesis acyltransferase [Gammaproteobacteria bacterium]